jgi:DNA-binding SARP family transcriptional activator
MDTRWQIELLGWLRATQGDRVVSRFRTRKTAALLAYLASHSHRSHPRDALVELFWPESDPGVARTALRVALSSLRRQLEPPGMADGRVLLADRNTVRLNLSAIASDVARFEVALDTATRAADGAERSATRGWTRRAYGIMEQRRQRICFCDRGTDRRL